MSSPGPIRPRWTNPVLWRRPAFEKRTEQQNLQLEEKSGTLALFRYGLIAPLVLEYPLPAGELTRRAREIAARVYDIPYSKRTSVSIDSLLNWVLRYREGGLEALIRKSRNDRRQFSSITPVIHALHRARSTSELTALACRAGSSFQIRKNREL